MSMHNGHRQRIKTRYREEGLDHFPAINVLEMLLFYCIPRKDTNPIAHRLLDRFGSFSAVLDAEVGELMQVEGISENAALFLTMLPDAFRYYRKDANRILIADNIETCSRYMADYFIGHTEEVIYLMCLDAKCKILCCREVGKGSVNSTAVSVRRIVETALNAKASAVVLAHNHPSGLAFPSEEDKRTTMKVASALRAVEVTLIDHLVFGDDDCVSLLQSGFYDPAAVE